MPSLSQQQQQQPRGDGTASPVPEHLNPTTGVRPRGTLPDNLRGLVFTKDESAPGGGLFVAAEQPNGDYSDIPKGTIVLKSGGDATGTTATAAATVSPVGAGGGRSAAQQGGVPESCKWRFFVGSGKNVRSAD